MEDEHDVADPSKSASNRLEPGSTSDDAPVAGGLDDTKPLKMNHGSSTHASSTVASEPPGYFALISDKNQDTPPVGTPADMPLFREPDFGADGTGDELDDVPKLPHESAPLPQDDSLSPTQTRS